MNEATAEPQLTLARAAAELELKQAACASLFGLGSGERWNADLELGTIDFSNRDLLARASAVQGKLAEAAQLCRDFGDRYALADLTTRKLECSQEDAWRFAALALHLWKGTGAYRGPAGDALVFMVFGEVRLSKRKDSAPATTAERSPARPQMFDRVYADREELAGLANKEKRAAVR
jgi:hypothetical protein